MPSRGTSSRATCWRSECARRTWPAASFTCGLCRSAENLRRVARTGQAAVGETPRPRGGAARQSRMPRKEVVALAAAVVGEMDKVVMERVVMVMVAGWRAVEGRW